MINITTLQGAKDVLSQYLGDEYCVIGPQNNGNIVVGFGWLVKIVDIENIIVHNEYEKTRKLYSYNGHIYDTRLYWKLKNMIANIPEDIIHMLIDEGYLVLEISEKEWDVQAALGTAPDIKKYLIRNKVGK